MSLRTVLAQDARPHCVTGMSFKERHCVWLAGSIEEHSHGAPSRLLEDITESVEHAYKTPPRKLSGPFLARTVDLCHDALGGRDGGGVLASF
jgi:hypothetical protein